MSEPNNTEGLNEHQVITKLESDYAQNNRTLEKVRDKLGQFIDKVEFDPDDKPSVMTAKMEAIGRVESVIKTLDGNKLQIAKMRIAAQRGEDESGVTTADLVAHALKELNLNITINGGDSKVEVSEHDNAAALAEEMQKRGITVTDEEKKPVSNVISESE